MVRHVFGGALRLAGVGVALGLGAALLMARAMQGVLYGVSTHDPAVFVGIGLLLPAAAVVASWIPARRAARVDPTEALRMD